MHRIRMHHVRSLFPLICLLAATTVRAEGENAEIIMLPPTVTTGNDVELSGPTALDLEGERWASRLQGPTPSPANSEKPATDRAEDHEAAPVEPPAYEIGSDLGLTAKWNHGLELQSKNKDFRVHVGGRTQIDTTWYSGSDEVETPIAAGGIGPLNDSWNLRRGRFRIDGTLWEVFEFACEYDFVNEIDVNPNPSLVPPQTNPAPPPVPTDLWIAVTQMPIGNVRVGVMKDPFGFEHLTSSRWLNFIERSFNQDTFYGPFNNGFVPGVMLHGTARDERVTWAIGEFKNTNNIFAAGVGDGEYETCGRVTMLPWYQDDGRYLVHLGMAAKYMALDEDQIRFRSRGNLRSGPPSSLNPVLANTGNILGDDQEALGLELASVWGPWTLQSEWTGSWVNDASTIAGNNASAGQQLGPGSALGTYFAHGYYVEVLYFLTGEHRAYNRKTGVFDRIVPLENFFWVRAPGGNCLGIGAWQVGARYSHLDLNDSGVNGGRLNSFTFGVNWFLNPNFKLQANYDVTQRIFTNILDNGGSGNITGFGVRCAFDF